MSGLSKQNQKMERQLGGKKVRSILEILKAEPPTFSGKSILDNEEIIQNQYIFSGGYCNNAESNLPQ